MTDFRILITGSREFKNYLTVHTALRRAALASMGRPIVVVVGRARGADTLAERAARDLGFQVEPHPADWKAHPHNAGHARNKEMVDLGADVCLAFYQDRAGNRGTADCVKRARKAGIPVVPSYGW